MLSSERGGLALTPLLLLLPHLLPLLPLPLHLYCCYYYFFYYYYYYYYYYLLLLLLPHNYYHALLLHDY